MVLCCRASLVSKVDLKYAQAKIAMQRCWARAASGAVIGDAWRTTGPLFDGLEPSDRVRNASALSTANRSSAATRRRVLRYLRCDWTVAMTACVGGRGTRGFRLGAVGDEG